jgi:acetolactate synthase-1/2/3 large subunit
VTTTAEYLAGFLRDRGVARIYGMPGGENTEVMVALRAAGVPFVLVHHEAVAAFAADAAGYLTGRPGVCLSTLGPGAANLFSGVSNAFLERAPLLALTADIEPGAKATTTHQHFPLAGFFGPITKASHVLTADNAAAVLPDAWDLTTDGLPGPVHVALSRAEAGRPVAERAPIPLVRRDLPAPDLRPVLAGLARARRPVLALGIGLAHAGAEEALRRLAERWGAPVICTPKAKGHLPESHPLFVGAYGVYGWRPVGEVLEAADAVLAIGLEGIDFIPAWRYDCPVYSLSPGYGPDPTYPQTALVEGDLATLLEELAAAPPPPVAWTAAEIADYRQRVLDLLAPRPETRCAPQHIIDSLRRVMPDDGVVSCDVGSHKLLICQQWRAEQPRTFLVANGGSAMGYGISSALAAAHLDPGRPVATVIGDGGLLMYPGDLETLVRTGTRATIVVLVDQALALIRNQQQRVGAAPYGVEFGQPDYAALGRAFGVATWEIDQPADADAALVAALAHAGPSLVIAHVDAAEYRRFH